MQNDDGLVERLRALYVWPQFVADEHADMLRPRQSKGLYAVGEVAHEAADTIEQLEAENARLREALDKANEAYWFYYGDEYSSDQCRDCIDECIREDFEWDNEPKGTHVLQISGARPVPDMWVALRYFTGAEKDERQDDEPYAFTVHATEEEARQALGDKAND